MPQEINRRQVLAISPVVGLAVIASKASAEDTSKVEPTNLLTVRPRSEDQKPWLMPPQFGSPQWPEGARGDNNVLFYEDVTRISISYRTDEKQLLQYLPRPYRLNTPIVTVGYSSNRGVSWLAGGSYNVISVSVSATYPGKIDNVSGGFPLVLWENLTAPILTGREKQGLPKIYGEIADHRVIDSDWKASLRNNGRTLLDMQANELVKVPSEVVEKFNNSGRRVNVLGWKYVPDETASKAILSYATAYPMTFEHREVWSAKGMLQWHPRKWEELPTQAHIVNALHGLPVTEILSCHVSKGSSLLYSGEVHRLS